ncbi:30S ribosomal protein S3 [Candidatus Falkowbacteria bacterium RIFOXYC2_FULL_48_21]|uniref:Small ribosomal subunit protein uS3 n=1 Tax=Candidatus Falkowbacteria bacterium RIFOXYC2_FULL_48_21 TaxID=1798005 RepID=A0A1F5TF49_9BACT|nr:MAG: 30S ribosomal protein S3 [Candidatus Falkowbacteria bacterium RIFOXYC2_FULL_48_21]
MGKKINPKIFRLKLSQNWDSRWFSVRNYAKFLRQDLEMKDFFRKKMAQASVSAIHIERTAKDINIIIYSARPGVIIGKGGSGIEDLRKEVIRKFQLGKNAKINITIKEISNPNLDAMVVGLGIKLDIEKRVLFRRAMKQAIGKVEKAGAKGVKVEISGRLNGAEIARTEKLLFGKVPLHTLRADIDYALVEAFTLYGVIGIKVWICRGEVFTKETKRVEAPLKKESETK